jgi:hypothetical protein
VPNTSAALAFVASLGALPGGNAGDAAVDATPGVADATFGADFGVRAGGGAGGVAGGGADGFSSRVTLLVSSGAQFDAQAGSTATACSGGAAASSSVPGVAGSITGSATLTVSTSAGATSIPRPDHTSTGDDDGVSIDDERTFTHTPAAACRPSETARATGTLGRATLNNDTVRRTVFRSLDFPREKRHAADARTPVSVPYPLRKEPIGGAGAHRTTGLRRRRTT